ncbi:MAG TPA: hypothetical protein VHX63_14025 [Acidobacteriaceae bacterium]|jgi:hypothetical protein|nr:hypothetical protein [Acidobacteriaceae bacterium]
MTRLLGLIVRLEALRTGWIEPVPQEIRAIAEARTPFFMESLNQLAEPDQAIDDDSASTSVCENEDSGAERDELGTIHDGSFHIVGST